MIRIIFTWQSLQCPPWGFSSGCWSFFWSFIHLFVLFVFVFRHHYDLDNFHLAVSPMSTVRFFIWLLILGWPHVFPARTTLFLIPLTGEGFLSFFSVSTNSPILLKIFSGSERGDSGGGVGGPESPGETKRRGRRQGRWGLKASPGATPALASKASPGASRRQGKARPGEAIQPRIVRNAGVQSCARMLSCIFVSFQFCIRFSWCKIMLNLYLPRTS